MSYGQVTQGQKALAVGVARELADRARADFKEAAETFALNPSTLVREALDNAAEDYQQARETQHAIAEWEVGDLA
jgi:hypothetical protein